MKDLSPFTTDELLKEIRRRCDGGTVDNHFVPYWAKDVIDVCAEVWGTTSEEILRRTNKIIPSAARTAAMGIVKFREKNRTLTELAQAFRRGDHSCLTIAVNRCDEKCRTDSCFRMKIKEALQRLNLTRQTPLPL